MSPVNPITPFHEYSSPRVPLSSGTSCVPATPAAASILLRSPGTHPPAGWSRAHAANVFAATTACHARSSMQPWFAAIRGAGHEPREAPSTMEPSGRGALGSERG
jgi:hypothetical protein